MNDVSQGIFSLIHSSDLNDKLSGIAVIGKIQPIIPARLCNCLCMSDNLVDVDGEENAAKITRFAFYLRDVLPCNDANVMTMAAKALGTWKRNNFEE
jgi:FKBP12-rapamycin complex-associated protein